LHLAALQKFQERGYAETTVRDIAAAAGVTERTFFRYFPSKEDLVLGEIRDLIPVFQDLVRQRPAEETPYQAVYAVALALSAGQPGLGVLFSGPPQRFAAKSSRQSQPLLRQFEDALADVLAERLGLTGASSRETLRAAVLAGAAMGAIRAALGVYSALPESEKTPDAAADLLRAAFDALKERRGPVQKA